MKTQNIVTMTMGQVATGREVIGLIAENKVKDNTRYAITAMDAEAGEITFTEILSDDAPEGTVADVVVITAENADVMRYIMNPNEKPVPEAEIVEEKGKKYLRINDTNIFLGTIDALRVVGGNKGEVFIAVPSKQEDRVDLMRYEVQTDKFSDFMQGLSVDVKMVNLEGSTFIINNIIEDVPQVDKDGKAILDENGDQVIRQRCIANAVLQYRDGSVVGGIGSDTSDYDEYDEYDDEYDEYEDEQNMLVPVDSIRIISQGTRKDIAVVTTKDVDEDGYLVDADEATILLFAFTGYVGSRVGTFFVKDPEAKIYLGGSFNKPPVVTVKDVDKILIRDRFGLKVIDDEEIVAEMEGFNYFLGTEVAKDDEGRDVVTFIYGSKAMEVKRFSMVNTDRGTLFEMC